MHKADEVSDVRVVIEIDDELDEVGEVDYVMRLVIEVREYDQ